MLNKIKIFLYKIFTKENHSELTILKDRIQSLEDDVNRLKKISKII